jgi:hypothetical protein
MPKSGIRIKTSHEPHAAHGAGRRKEKSYPDWDDPAKQQSATDIYGYGQVREEAGVRSEFAVLIIFLQTNLSDRLQDITLTHQSDAQGWGAHFDADLTDNAAFAQRAPVSDSGTSTSTDTPQQASTLARGNLADSRFANPTASASPVSSNSSTPILSSRPSADSSVLGPRASQQNSGVMAASVFRAVLASHRGYENNERRESCTYDWENDVGMCSCSDPDHLIG